MGYVLDECPVVHSCCWCMPLRVGTAVCGMVGLVGAGGFLWAGSAEGAQRLADMGAIDATILKPVRYFCGASGVLMAAANALLLAAVTHESDALCEVYIWFMVTWSAALCLLAASVIIHAAIMSSGFPAFVVPFSALIFVLLSYCLILVAANYRMTLP